MTDPKMHDILVVDDEPDLEVLVRQKFRRDLRERRLAMRFARDGEEALQMVAQAVPDLVLTDINMPRMDGLTLLGHLQAMVDGPATVIVSAYGDIGNIRTAMNRGAFDFLTKPIDLADLQATVERTLRHVATQRDNQARRLAAERAQAALSRYFSPNLAARLAAGPGGPELTGQRREVTAMFTDVANFTELVEGLAATALLPLLNGYFSGMTGIIFAHGGTVAKVMGDALLLLFGAPDDQPDHAARALACALALDDFAEAFRAARLAEGLAFGVTRIGLHSGEALVGDFGGGGQLDYTAYGDTINIAARLEAANKVLGTRICVSHAVADRVPGAPVRPVGELLLRGRSAPIAAFEPMAPGHAAWPQMATYARAFAALGQDDAAAAAGLAELSGGDALARFHATRLAQGGAGRLLELP